MKKPKFLVDTMLGRLCTWLRILGFDAAFVKENQRKNILERSFLERRILITREAKLGRAHAYKLVLLKHQHWSDQLLAVWESLKLDPVSQAALFFRCTECNKELEKIQKSKLKPDRVPAKVFEFQKEFHRCPKCRKIFWPGSHLINTLAKLKEIGIPLKAH